MRYYMRCWEATSYPNIGHIATVTSSNPSSCRSLVFPISFETNNACCQRASQHQTARASRAARVAWFNAPIGGFDA
eukprot:s1497_g2.t1